MASGKVQFQLATMPVGVFENQHLNLELIDLHTALQFVQDEIARSSGVARLVAGEAITKMHAVTIENNILFHADRLIPKVAVGIALETAAIGTPAYFALFAGYVKRFAGLVPNKTYYLDIAGALVDVKPVSGIIQAIGYSLSATEMFVSVQLP